MDDIIKRIKELMKKEGLNISQTAVKIGVSQPNLSAILSGKRPIGDNMINRFVISFDINKEWLLTGQGEKFKSPNLNNGINLGSIGGDNKSTYTNVANTPNNIVEILEQKLKFCDKEIERLEQLLSEKEENIKSLKEIIALLKNK